ncbi:MULTISPECIES: WecB/TagA/CpsF family glycosyltransferase [Methylosinus]|uniref:Glycosyltransferase n=1 Tax=Methylosinus trichosporium (strain ATCC 35070 / NCIMB 11131 / UNIQEM 75 / OB3b) TaxID=595536 RepID=A0A2D2CZK6_METT3|nr:MULTISPECIES: WecB/TagA/CpsF family glycosyltransferase [Methylosinus]ATQ68170.1 glycosyltransferase [Methylosinus trichosporium OB3b]OBS53435.1 UDP-hexose transferase [Methylosinus sp. 3S-1]
MESKDRGRPFGAVETIMVGGAQVARLDLEQTARLMIETARGPAPEGAPLFLTSVNGEALARRDADPDFAALIDGADLVNADGQPLVVASRLLARNALPERVATTDLYPLVAGKAEGEGVSFYLLGASEESNRGTFQATKRRFPRLDIRGRCHGFLTGAALERKVEEIDALAPDILWLALGVPREQEFVRHWRHRLRNVKMIKTSGGLFDFMAGAKKRAPLWMQQAGLEWAFRLALEPRRLLRRYATTNPVALMLLMRHTR